MLTNLAIKEYRCLDCGTQFETSSSDPSCPTCASGNEERAFFTPPAIRSAGTSFKDATVKALAADFGLSDMSNKHGEAVKKGGGGQFASPQMIQQLPIPQQHRDQFSPIHGVFQHPNRLPRRRERA